MKRLNAPKFWKIERKNKKFSVQPKPGPHKKYQCIPLAVLLRDILGYVENIKEAKEILNKGIVKTNGIVCKNYNYPAGLMDIVSIGDENYRLFPTKTGLGLIKTKDDIRLIRVDNKTMISKNKIQLNMHDGTNIVGYKDEIKTGDVLVIKNSKISEKIELKKGCTVVITNGKNRGEIGKLNSIEIIRSSKPNKVHIQIGKEKVETLAKYIFVIGNDKPIIDIEVKTDEKD